MEAISGEFRVALPWEIVYADDLVMIAETEYDLTERLNKWKDNVENRGVRVNMKQEAQLLLGWPTVLPQSYKTNPYPNPNGP